MAKTNPGKKPTTPKTQARKTTPKTQTRTGTTPRTQTKAVVVRRVVKEPPVEYVKIPRQTVKSPGINPWMIVGGVAALAIFLFVPIWPSTKTVQKTETIMVPVQKERQEQVTVDEQINVYQGWLQEEGETIERTGYTTEAYTVIRYDYWGDPYYDTEYVQVPYTYTDKGEGRTITIVPADQIVQVQQSPGENNTRTYTLTDASGQMTMYRKIGDADLTKTGRTTVQVTKTVSTPYTVQEPQQVTNDVEQKIRVNLVGLMFGSGHDED